EAEDGIRDRNVTGVQTCALPISASQVFIEVSVVPPEAPGAGPKLRIAVDDDGRGLSEDERAKVARRGQRLDESKPGSGLGLSIEIGRASCRVRGKAAGDGVATRE